MCSIGEHNCPACDEPYPCYASDYDCQNTMPYPCEKCEYWMEESYKEDQRKSEWEREQRERWEAEFYGKD